MDDVAVSREINTLLVQRARLSTPHHYEIVIPVASPMMSYARRINDPRAAPETWRLIGMRLVIDTTNIVGESCLIRRRPDV